MDIVFERSTSPVICVYALVWMLYLMLEDGGVLLELDFIQKFSDINNRPLLHWHLTCVQTNILIEHSPNLHCSPSSGIVLTVESAGMLLGKLSDNRVVELSPTSSIPVASFFRLVLGLDDVSLEGVSFEETSLEEDWAVVAVIEVVADTIVDTVVLVLLVLLLGFAVVAKVLPPSDCT